MKLTTLSLAVVLAGFATHAQSQFMTAPVPDEPASMQGIGVGHDFKRLAAAAKALPEKREFESSTDFAERLTTAESRPVYGDVRLTDRLLVTGPLKAESKFDDDGMLYRYDADQQTLRLCYASSYGGLGAPTGTVVLKFLESNRKAGGSYVGTNAFGVKARVQRSAHYTFQILATQPILGPNCFTPTPMSPNDARARLKGGAMWGMVGKLQAPYVRHGENYLGPTVRSPAEVFLEYESLVMEPIEVIAFSRDTGEVFYKATRVER